MKNFFYKFFKIRAQKPKPLSAEERKVISASYRKLQKEMESLRLYDLGEKEINAPDLRALARRV